MAKKAAELETGTEGEEGEVQDAAQAKAEADRKAFNADKEAHRKERFAFVLTKESFTHGVLEADLLKTIEALPEQDRTIERVSALAEQMGTKARLATLEAENKELKAKAEAGSGKRPYIPSPAGGGGGGPSWKELLKSGKPMPPAAEIDRMTADWLQRSN